MTLKQFVSSAMATIMVMEMLILALAMLPVNAPFLSGNSPAVATETPQEAGFFGCLVGCLGCAIGLGKIRKACQKCGSCLDPGFGKYPGPAE